MTEATDGGGPVRTEVDGQILIVTLDRPKANAIDVPTSHALYRAFARLRDDDDLRVGVLTGAGDRIFSAGWDLKAAAGGEAVDADHGPGGFGGLTQFPDLGKPVIAAMNGLALAGGFELALAADLMIAAEHAEFALTEVRVGLVPDAGGLLRIPARLPRAIALELLLTGRRMGAAEAARWGLLNAVVPAAQLMDAALAMAREICAAAPLSIAAVLEILRATEGLGVADGFAVLETGDLPGYKRMQASEDSLEGARAFTQKREPVWRGR